MPESTIIKTKQDGLVEILDGTSTVIYTVAYEEGNFNLTVPGYSVQMILDRGRIGSTPSLRRGDDAPMTGSFSANLRDIYDAGYNTLMGIMTDNVVTGTPTLGSTADVKTWHLRITFEGTNHGDSADHTVTCNHCRITGSVAEGDPTVLTCNFTSYALYPTLT